MRRYIYIRKISPSYDVESTDSLDSLSPSVSIIYCS